MLFRSLAVLARSEGESVLAELTGFLIADDQAQRDYLTEALRIIVKRYPERLSEALQSIAASHEAPELAAQLQTYLA